MRCLHSLSIPPAPPFNRVEYLRGMSIYHFGGLCYGYLINRIKKKRRIPNILKFRYFEYVQNP